MNSRPKPPMYDYVRQAYSVDPTVGQAVKHTVTGEEGRIAPENPGQGQYVMVFFPKSKHPMPCHPTELEYGAKRQFVAIKFRATDNRTFTYHNDGEPVSPGDLIRIPDKSGEGWKRVTVESVTLVAPTFQTKPIVGPDGPEITPPAEKRGPLL